MRNIKLTIEYDGTEYCGWQSQTNGPAVQDFIEKALRKIFRKEISVTGAARTDSGVHAHGQIANFKTNSSMPLEKIKDAINGNLPDDISVISASEAGDSFNAQYSAKSKLYRYSIYNRREKSPFSDRFSFHIPAHLDVEKMDKASKALLGKHNFSSFKGSKGVTKNQERAIKKISVRRKGNFVIIDIEADGFLYNMARNIAGTLIEIGRGKIKPQSMKAILSANDRSKSGLTAPSRALTLVKVKY